jgi:signal transduction histidine kinase/CheY-like chemotaxis protein
VITAAHSGEIVFWGRGAQQTFGYSAGEMIGQPLSAIVRLPRLRAGGSFRVDATRKGGESFRAGVVVEPLSQADDAPMSIVIRDESRWSLFADFVDIVTQHRTFAAAAPRVAEAIGRTLDFEAVAVWATDEAAPHRTVWWSANGSSLRESGLVERVRRSGESATGEDAMAFPIVDRTLVVHVLEVFCRPDSDYQKSIVDDLARIAGSAGRFISRERMSVELQRQLGETRRLSSLGQLAATMAHEFNNVLMGISTFAEVLRRRTAGEVPVQNAVAQIQQSLGRGRRITDEILRFTRDPAPAMATIDVRRWLTDFLPEASALAGDRAELQVEEELFIRGDIALLNQVLANLIINARDAAPEGAIRIIAKAAGDERLDLVIADSGSGIAPEIRERIFEPLFTTKRGGTGLGLAVVHQAVSAQGGTIEVESEVGRGTEFHLRFPLVASDGELSDGRPVSRVLLVEDDPAVTFALCAVLEAEGIGVRTATNGRAAINSLAKEIPDVVLLDIGLPDVSGADVYTEIATRWPHLPVVFITAELDDSAVAQFLRRPHIGFLRKPFEAEQLLETLSRITAAKRPQSGRKSVSGRPSGSRRPK